MSVATINVTPSRQAVLRQLQLSAGGPGWIAQATIARRTGLSRGCVSRVIAQLECEQLVECTPNAGRRPGAVMLADAGPYVLATILDDFGVTWVVADRWGRRIVSERRSPQASTQGVARVISDLLDVEHGRHLEEIVLICGPQSREEFVESVSAHATVLGLPVVVQAIAPAAAYGMAFPHGAEDRNLMVVASGVLDTALFAAGNIVAGVVDGISAGRLALLLEASNEDGSDRFRGAPAPVRTADLVAHLCCAANPKAVYLTGSDLNDPRFREAVITQLRIQLAPIGSAPEIHSDTDSQALLLSGAVEYGIRRWIE